MYYFNLIIIVEKPGPCPGVALQTIILLTQKIAFFIQRYFLIREIRELLGSSELGSQYFVEPMENSTLMGAPLESSLMNRICSCSAVIQNEMVPKLIFFIFVNTKKEPLN